MYDEYITDWSQLEELDNYPELVAIAAELAAHGAAEYEPELTGMWDEEIRADAMRGVC